MILRVANNSGCDYEWHHHERIAQTVGLSAAVDYLSEIGMDRIRAHERELTNYALARLDDRVEEALREERLAAATAASRKGRRKLPFH